MPVGHTCPDEHRAAAEFRFATAVLSAPLGAGALLGLIAGASSLASEAAEVGSDFGVEGWLGGGAWNMSSVAEAANWGQHPLVAAGRGAYIAGASAAGSLARTVLGIAGMSAIGVTLDRVLWRALYVRAERKYRIS